MDGYFFEIKFRKDRMNSRILTFCSLSGILVAAGCGGGGSTGSHVSSAIPTIGGSTTASKGTGSFVASFEIPYSAARASAASSRSPRYLSPGTTGLTILLGNGTASTTAASVAAGTLGGAQTISTPLAGTPLTYSVATGAYAVGDTLTVAGITTGLVQPWTFSRLVQLTGRRLCRGPGPLQATSSHSIPGRDRSLHCSR